MGRSGIEAMPERLPNTYPEKDRHGKVRWRYRKSGRPSAQLPGKPGSPEFLAAYVNASKAEVSIQSPTRVREGSMRSLINDYCQDPMFSVGRTKSTQKNYRGVYRRFCNEHGDKSYKAVKLRNLRAIIRAKSVDSQNAARRLHTALSMLFDYAVETDRINTNPMLQVKRPKAPKSDGHHTWTDDEISKYREAFSVGTNERLAMELLLGTGQRGIDVHEMGWQHVRDGSIKVKQEKTDVGLWLPIVATLAECLEHVRGDLTFIINSTGKPYKCKSFQQWFSKSCTDIGLPQCSAHGLRKARGRIMAESDCTDRQIMAVLGHETAAMATLYTKAANQKKLAEQAFGKTEASEPYNTHNKHDK